VKLAETAVVNAVAFQGFLRPYRGWNICQTQQNGTELRANYQRVASTLPLFENPHERKFQNEKFQNPH